MSQTATIEPGSAGRVGPNAVLQLTEALRRAGRAALTQTLFARAGALAWLQAPPQTMIDEAGVGRLHQAVWQELPRDQAVALMEDAGRLTADYLLANRIPRLVQVILKALPARLAAAVLIRAILANAWTFVGSGRLVAHSGRQPRLDIHGNPFCAGLRADFPVCAWHRAVFARLFATLVSRRARVVEIGCEANGDPCCSFVIRWDTP